MLELGSVFINCFTQVEICRYNTVFTVIVFTATCPHPCFEGDCIEGSDKAGERGRRGGRSYSIQCHCLRCLSLSVRSKVNQPINPKCTSSSGISRDGGREFIFLCRISVNVFMKPAYTVYYPYNITWLSLNELVIF